MGGRFSHVHYRAQDAAVVPHFQLLTQVWGLKEIALLSFQLRRLSFNFCLTPSQFADWLALRPNPLFQGMLAKWFDTFRNTPTSTIVNGLEVLTALALASWDGQLVDKIGAVFDIFDFDDSAMITLDELCILLKSVVRGLSKVTVGLGPRLVAICPMPEVTVLARQCFAHADLEEEQDLPRELFIQWAKRTPKIVNLLRCFVRREFLTQEEAAMTIQRCARGMHGRRVAAHKRYIRQLELDQEVHDAAQKIQEAVVTRKKKRDNLRQMKIEKFAHHGALYAFGSNVRAQLGQSSLATTTLVPAPALTPFFKHNELRVLDAALSPVHACAVASNGEIFTWGAGVPGSFGILARPSASDENGGLGPATRKTPTRVDDLSDVAITACALGNHHTVALSETGVVYTWGSGAFGQLGHGDIRLEGHDLFKRQFDPHTGREYPFVDLPLPLDRSFFEEMHVRQVACGYYCTLAVCEDGSVFAWGEGSEGQLGLGYSEHFHVGFLDDYVHGSSFVYMPTPTRLEELKEPIESVAIGGNHVFAVTRDHRRVYEWGAWQRRRGDTQEATFSPQVNEHLSTLGVTRIACGREHALALAARVQVSLYVDTSTMMHGPPPATAPVVQTFGLCALFGAPPVSLTRALSGSLFMYGQSPHSGGGSVSVTHVPTSSSSTMSGSGNLSGSMSAMLSATIYERKESYIRSSLGGCTGTIVFLERSTWTGHWVLIPIAPTTTEGGSAGRGHGGGATTSLLEVPCIPAAFGPELTETGVCNRLWYSPEKLRSLRLYVRPDEIVGRLVVLEVDHDDITFESDDLELSEMITLIMISLVERVKDAQESGAAAVIIVFDFLDADPFPLEAAEDEAFAFTIPVVMVKRQHHGELLLEQVSGPSSKPYGAVCYREDILSKQVLTAQKIGAKAIIIAQNRIEQHPIRLRKAIFEIGAAKASEAAGVKIPVVMIPFDEGEALKTAMRDVRLDDSTLELGVSGAGVLYAWGCGDGGRLGLGDTDNDEVFDTGFDGATQTSYQYVDQAEMVASLFYRQITDIACGDEHSAAVSSDGVLYCWGSGRGGKLGNGGEDDELAPYPVEALASVRVAKVACGPQQTFAITHTPSITASNK